MLNWLPKIILICILLTGCSSSRWYSVQNGTTAPIEKINKLLYKWNPYTVKTPLELLNCVFNDIQYKKDPDDIWQDPKYTYEKKQGDCEDKALLLLACLLNEGYTALLVIGTTNTTVSAINHAWVVLIVGGQEYYLDPTDLDSSTSTTLQLKSEPQFSLWGEHHRYSN